MEITILSAENLKNTSTLLSNRLKPYVTITTFPPATSTTSGSDDKRCHVYKTRVDDQGGANPSWGDDKFHVLIDNTFFANRYSCIFLQIYTERFILGETLLGWCQIPVDEIIGYPPPAGLVRNLSYRLRDKDGSRGQGIVNVLIKLNEYSVPVTGQTQTVSQPLRPLKACHVIGIPVARG